MEHRRTSTRSTSMVEQNIKVYKVDKKLQSNEILEFCKFANSFADDPAHVNMYHKYWQDHPETLPYLIYNSDRFKDSNGDFFVLKLNRKIVAISGVQKSSFDDNVAMAGIRSWIVPNLRAKMYIGHYLLPEHLAWAKSNGLKTVLLSFNNYNKRLMNYFKRTGMGVPKKRNETRLFHNGVFEVPFSVNIQHTEQWVLYHKIDETYEPNWENIRFK